MEQETAGDPITGVKWSRKTTQKIANELKALGIDIHKNTAGRLLKSMRFSLRVNHKKISNGSKKNRDAQFDYIKRLRNLCVKSGDPIISVDTKKKELIGQFKNQGKAWRDVAKLVNDHDFPSLAVGVGFPYGIYDVKFNDGSVFVGTSHDTPEFAVDSIEMRWRYDGCKRYPKATHLYILADGGGSNGSANRAWKSNLQKKLCDGHGLTVTVSHYPPGASKWNPIEHRLFSEISRNWQGIPLENYETALNYIRTTKTRSGLKVKAYLNKKKYVNGKKISDDEMSELFIEDHRILRKWNYTIYSL